MKRWGERLTEGKDEFLIRVRIRDFRQETETLIFTFYNKDVNV